MDKGYTYKKEISFQAIIGVLADQGARFIFDAIAIQTADAAENFELDKNTRKVLKEALLNDLKKALDASGL